MPTVKIAPAAGWPAGDDAGRRPGLKVVAFATRLDHPRWLYVLPNGDILVAETNRPQTAVEEGGVKRWVMKRMMARAGAGTPSPDRITLLRDGDGDGVAEMRSTFLEGPSSPFGMALVGNEFYVATADAIIRFPYTAGAASLESSVGVKVVDLPAGINHHWTKNLLASRDGKHLYVTVGSNSNVGENRYGRGRRSRRHLGSRSEGRDEEADRQRTAQPERYGMGAEDGSPVDGRQRAR